MKWGAIAVGTFIVVVSLALRRPSLIATTTAAGDRPAQGTGLGGAARPRNHLADVVDDGIVRSVREAREHMVAVDDGIYLWFRTWGDPTYGVPILFVHGGPGQAVLDYGDGNERFFDYTQTFVVEVDQRGTGSSQPSVRDDWRNMQLYRNITIGVISADFEVVRTYLGVKRWVVWGGSYGSTIGLDYAMDYPNSVLALILRGIYLDTVAEMDEVYTQDAFVNDPKKLADYMQLYSFAAKEATARGRKPPDPNHSYGLVREYEKMILRGNRMAIWQWHAFENNLMEEDPDNLLDPNIIVEEKFAEAQSLGYFETRLWLHQSWEDPSTLLARVDRLADIPTWICQGLRDNVCPPHNARHLVNAMNATCRGAPLQSRFLASGHEDTDPVMEDCLVLSMNEFLGAYELDFQSREGQNSSAH